jgi:hypothetical protein
LDFAKDIQMLQDRFYALRAHCRADFVVLGMSGSYQTLFRRIEAMKHTKKLTRRQIVLAGFAFLILCGAAIIPWRVVAQEGKQAGENSVKSAVDADKTAAAKDEKAKSSPEQLLVGVWRGGPTNGELVFHQDGTYQEFSLADPAQPVAGASLSNQRGTWNIKDGKLTLRLEATPAAFLRGLVDPFPGETYMNRTLHVLRLDNVLLRLQEQPELGANGVPGGVGLDPRTLGALPMPGAEAAVGAPDAMMIGAPAPSPVLFYHRDNEKSAQQPFDSSIPADFRRIAELAQLTPGDALALVDMFHAANRVSKQVKEELHWELVDNVVQARNGKLDFAELFQLTAEEAKAYKYLLALPGTGYSSICALAAQGQLAPEELSAVHKLESFQQRFFHILSALRNVQRPEMSNPYGSAQYGPAGALPNLTGEISPSTKLMMFFDGLETYLNSTAFNR